MRFYEQLNQYMKAVNCTAKELCTVSGISAAALSRYRSGERVPDVHSETFEQLCSALETLALKREGTNLTKTEIRQQFLACSNMKSTDKEQLRQNFNTLISVLNLNITKLCQHISYDTSTIFRFRNGSRSPADPDWAFAIPGRVPNHSRNQLVLDMTREDVREYLLERLTTIVHDAKIDYVKWDMNRSVCDVYSHVAAQSRNGELYHRYVLGVYDLMERFLAACPNLLLEGCSGGGGRYDAGRISLSS